MAKKKESTEIQKKTPVIPLIQTEVLEDGTVISKRVKPLTYSLMSWVKRHMNVPDTINIEDNEDFAQFQLTMPSPDEDFEYDCYFNTDEKNGLIMFYMYYLDDEIPGDKEQQIKYLILNSNMQCLTGQVQMVSNTTSKLIRYYSGLCVEGIASEDPEYAGEFQISPLLYQNMFVKGFNFMNKFVDELKEVLEN